MRSLPLKTRLILLAVAPATLLALGLGGWMVRSSYVSLREQALAGQLALARSLAAQADLGISQAFQAVEFMAKAPSVIRLDKSTAENQLSTGESSADLLDG